MEVLEEGHRIVCLYQLIDGSVASSFARHIAHLAGLPPELLQRAAEVQNNYSPQLVRTDRCIKSALLTRWRYPMLWRITDPFIELRVSRSQSNFKGSFLECSSATWKHGDVASSMLCFQIWSCSQDVFLAWSRRPEHCEIIPCRCASHAPEKRINFRCSLLHSKAKIKTWK